MAGESKQYANIIVYRDGVLLTEENKVKITRDFGNKEIITTARGFAGTVKGAAIMKVDITNAVPAAGVEYDPGPDGETAIPHDWTFIRGGQQITAKLIVMSDDTDHSAGGESSLSFSLVGPSAQWQQL